MLLLSFPLINHLTNPLSDIYGEPMSTYSNYYLITENWNLYQYITVPS